MFTILPCRDEKRLDKYQEGTNLLIYKEDGAECGSVAYRVNGSAYEISELLLGDTVEDNERYLRADALIRSVGSIALNDGVITLCTKDREHGAILERLGFFEHGEYLIIYLNKLFSGMCKGCEKNK